MNSLQKELESEPFPVLVEELKENNRDFVNQVNQLTDRQALEDTKNSVLNNVGEKKVEKLVDNLLVKIKEIFASEEERSVVCKEIYFLRENGNAWEKELLERKRDVFEKFLEGVKKEDSSNYDNSSIKPNYFLPILAILSIIVGFLLIVRWRLKLKR